MPRCLGEGTLLPVLDPHNAPWFTSGRLQTPSCNDCNTSQFPPEDVCIGCRSANLEFREASGDGTVESAVEVHFPVHPQLKDRVPYNIAVISIDGAPRCNAIGNLTNLGSGDVEISQRVRAIYEEAIDPSSGEKLLIPNWEAI
ncbi:MAG: hypothetical protein CL908_19760 [Deltaproteobacteria bacterium]|nr:hypothetical protein [Deltaproteobacteria bacterium]